MNRYMMEEFHGTRDLYQEIDRSARRERARAIGAGYAWLERRLATWLGNAKARLGRHSSIRPSHWIARLG